MSHPPPRIPDHAVLSRFGTDPDALLGGGGEAAVYAIDDDRVLRLPRTDVAESALDARRELIGAIRAEAPFELPEVLEHVDVDGRTVVVERRLPGRNALEVLGEPGTDREALVRSHLDAAASIADLPCPTSTFGEVWGDGAIEADAFAAWATARLQASLAVRGHDFAHLGAEQLTDDLVGSLPEPEPPTPLLVHLDAYLGNMLADADRITAVLDFGPMTVGGPRHLDPLVAVAYLASEITPTATEADRSVARAWADERDLRHAVVPAERWMAAYWTGAVDDEHLQQWCDRILGCRP